LFCSVKTTEYRNRKATFFKKEERCSLIKCTFFGETDTVTVKIRGLGDRPTQKNTAVLVAGEVK